jgi:hypothetical protein
MMDTQELLRAKLVCRLANAGAGAPPDICAGVVIRDLDAEAFLAGTLHFAAAIPPAVAELWYRAFTRTLFFAGDPARWQPDHLSPDGSIGWHWPDRARRFETMSRALRLFRAPAPLPALPPVLTLGGPGSVAVLQIATASLSTADYLIHTSHLLCEGSLCGLLLPGDRLRVEHVHSLDVQTAFRYPEKKTLWRIAETQRGSGELKLHAYLTGARHAHP